MSQAVGAVMKAPNILNLSASISTVENHQETLSRMIDSLESVLFGTDVKGCTGTEVSCSGFEIRLSEVVSRNEEIISRLDRVISRL